MLHNLTGTSSLLESPGVFRSVVATTLHDTCFFFDVRFQTLGAGITVKFEGSPGADPLDLISMWGGLLDLIKSSAKSVVNIALDFRCFRTGSVFFLSKSWLYSKVTVFADSGQYSILA